jgi:hypothetical protein
MEGVAGCIQQEADALVVAASMARYKYSANNAYIADIGAGLYTMISTDQGLYDVKELISRDPRTGNEEKTGARVIISMETLYKAMFGPLVNHNGRAIPGAGDIVEAAKESIIPVIDGKIPMPRAYASVQKKTATGEMIEAVIEGEPIRVYRKVSGERDALIIDLDYFFFPAIGKGGGLRVKKGEIFIHQVAGLTSFLQLGAKIHREGHKTGSINVQTARKIMLVAQAAYELRYFAPGIVKENFAGRTNILLRRTAVKDLYPSAVDTTGRIRFRDFSDAVALAGKYFHHAINATGIMTELQKRGNVIIPAIDKGAEFPPGLPNVVYIKADRVK